MVSFPVQFPLQSSYCWFLGHRQSFQPCCHQSACWLWRSGPYSYEHFAECCRSCLPEFRRILVFQHRSSCAYQASLHTSDFCSCHWSLVFSNLDFLGFQWLCFLKAANWHSACSDFACKAKESEWPMKMVSWPEACNSSSREELGDLDRSSSPWLPTSALAPCNYSQLPDRRGWNEYTRRALQTRAGRHSKGTTPLALFHICNSSFARGLLGWSCISMEADPFQNSWAGREVTRCRPFSDTFCLEGEQREQRTLQFRQHGSCLVLQACIL